MSEFLKMDVFFVIATIGFVVMAVLIICALWYIVQILRTISRVADSVEEEATALKEDFREARESIKRQGIGLLSGVATLFGMAGKSGKRILKKRKS